MYSLVLSFASSCSIPFFFFLQDTRFPWQLGLQPPGQLQISLAVGGLGGWELGGDVERGGDDGKWRGRREREGGAVGGRGKEEWEKFEKGREKEKGPASLRDRSPNE